MESMDFKYEYVTSTNQLVNRVTYIEGEFPLRDRVAQCTKIV